MIIYGYLYGLGVLMSASTPGRSVQPAAQRLLSVLLLLLLLLPPAHVSHSCEHALSLQISNEFERLLLLAPLPHPLPTGLAVLMYWVWLYGVPWLVVPVTCCLIQSDPGVPRSSTMVIVGALQHWLSL